MGRAQFKSSVLAPPHFPLALGCRIVEFKKVEKLGIESDGHKGIVLNLTGMTEPNLVDDSPKMGESSIWTLGLLGYGVRMV